MTTGTTGTVWGDFDSDELVTGEAVALDLPAARLGPRIGAALLDVMFSVGLFYFLVIALTMAAFGGLATGMDLALGTALLLLVMLSALVGYPVAMETFTRGRTLGKIAAGTRTVRQDGGAIGFRHALVRGLVGFVEIYLLMGLPAVVCALLDGRGRRLGDLAAGTYVVTQRMGLRLAAPAAMPPFLAPWAQAADISPLPDSLALATRQLLSRAHTLTPAAREAIGQELYSELLRHVAPAPPPGVHPEYVMAALLAERGRRDAVLIRTRDAAIVRVLPKDELRQGRYYAPITGAAQVRGPVDPSLPPSAPASTRW